MRWKRDARVRAGGVWICRVIEREGRAAYHAAHREENNAYARAYRAAHREEKNACARAYYAAYYAAYREEKSARARDRYYALDGVAYNRRLLRLRRNQALKRMKIRNQRTQEVT